MPHLLMIKNTTGLRHAIYALIVLVVTFFVAFADVSLLPNMFCQIPHLHTFQTEYPYVGYTMVTTIGMLIAIYFVIKAPAIEKQINIYFNKSEKLNKILAHSSFAPDTGIAILDSKGHIVSATGIFVQLSIEKKLKALAGKHYADVYPYTILRLFSDVVARATATKQVAAVTIAEWKNYYPDATGSIVLYAAPSIHGDRYKGSVVVIRSTSDVEQAENSTVYYQMHYQVLFDYLPIGAGEFRPAIAPDGGADGYLIVANATLKRMMEGVPLPYQDPCSMVWPSFLQQHQLRDAITKAQTGMAVVSCELFSPAVGKHFDIVITSLPGGRILAMVRDLTEQHINAQKVLALSDQLHRTLASHALCLSSMQSDLQHFTQASADLMETHLETVSQISETLVDADATKLNVACAGLYKIMSQMLRFYNVANLPFKETSLVYPEEVVARLLEPLENRFPQVAFEIENLPGVVANRTILTDILEQLIVSLAQQPVIEPPAKIHVGSRSDFTTTYLTVSCWGIDTSAIFIETPTEKQPLDWTLTSDLDLAPVRTMISRHGGELMIGPTPDGLGTELCCSIGTPIQ